MGKRNKKPPDSEGNDAIREMLADPANSAQVMEYAILESVLMERGLEYRRVDHIDRFDFDRGLTTKIAADDEAYRVRVNGTMLGYVWRRKSESMWRVQHKFGPVIAGGRATRLAAALFFEAVSRLSMLVRHTAAIKGGA